MPDEALDNADPSEAHVPWDSIGSSDESIESLGGHPYDCGLMIEDSGLVEADPATPIRNPQSEISNSEQSVSFAPQPARPRFEAQGPAMREGGWTIPALCAGIALIACCVLIPQADANRRLAYEKVTLTRDLQNIEKQIDVNREFLKKVGDDPTLAQRLAERQMKVIPQGAHVVDLTHDSDVMSPFQLLSVAPPTPLPPYQPMGGTLARICYGSQSRLYLIGLSLGLIAMGLVLGTGPIPTERI